MFANEMALWIMVFLAMTNIFQITRNTRAEEETGRAELVRSLPVGRHAATVAALLLVVIVDVAFSVLGGVLITTVGGLAAADPFALMAGVVMTGLVFAAVATVTCQQTVYGHGASGMAFAVVGAAALIRSLGDIQEPHGSWLSWLSPIAWTQQMRPYVR
jgi:ABC-2 type transport system permease protein